MNSVRIGIIGVLVDRYGIGQAEGFLHFFEGWMIFLSCITLLFFLVRVMQWLSGDRRPLGEAIDLDFSGLGGQLARVCTIPASRGLVAAALLTTALSAAWVLAPRAAAAVVLRDPFSALPAPDRRLGRDHRRAAAEASRRPSAPTTISPRSTRAPPRRRRSTSSSPITAARPKATPSTRPRSACRPPAGRSSRSSGRDRPARHPLRHAAAQPGDHPEGHSKAARLLLVRGPRPADDQRLRRQVLHRRRQPDRGRTDGGLVRVITPVGEGGRGRGRRPAAALPRRQPRPAEPLPAGLAARAHGRPPPLPRRYRAAPVVSILVVSYNTRAMTLDCLRSLAAETRCRTR